MRNKRAKRFCTPELSTSGIVPVLACPDVSVCRPNEYQTESQSTLDDKPVLYIVLYKSITTLWGTMETGIYNYDTGCIFPIENFPRTKNAEDFEIEKSVTLMLNRVLKTENQFSMGISCYHDIFTFKGGIYE